MAFKIKHPFKFNSATNNQRTLGRDGRIISPVKQQGLSQDYKDAIAAGKNVDPKLVGNLKDPRNQAEYYGSFDIQPKLELSEGDWLDKAIEFGYNNPWIGKGVSKLAGTGFDPFGLGKKGYRAITDYMMRKSGGMGGGFSSRELYNPELESYYKEMEDDLKSKLENNEITQAEYDKEFSEIRPSGYSGDDQVAWRDQPIDLVGKYLGGDGGGLVKQTRYSPLSDDYNWLDTWSIKGGFDENLDRIDTTSGYENYDPNDATITGRPQRTYRENFSNMTADAMKGTWKFKPGSDEVDTETSYIDDKSMEDNFKDLYGGKTFFGGGVENSQLNRGYLGSDLGGSRIGFGLDSKLPYMSAWDAWDFQAHGPGGWSQKWANAAVGEDPYNPAQADDAKKDYMMAQLLNRASRDLGGKGGFKVYDRFYFTPDKYRDYIKDKDVDFMKDFYNIHHAGDQSTWQAPTEISSGSYDADYNKAHDDYMAKHGWIDPEDFDKIYKK